MSILPRGVREAAVDYSRGRITARELVDFVFDHDEGFFRSHGKVFKDELKMLLIRNNHKSPSQRVQAVRDFDEAFYDHYSGIESH